VVLRFELLGEVDLIFHVRMLFVFQVLMAIAKNSGHSLARELQVMGKISEACAMFGGAPVTT
jgi:hypothetical protein